MFRQILTTAVWMLIFIVALAAAVVIAHGGVA